jgi:hypothetical protein
MNTLKATLGLLGQVNDDWTAHYLYENRNEHKKQHKTLSLPINAEWNEI